MQRSAVFLASAAIVVAVVLAYANTLRAPLIFDDVDAVRNNPSIRQLGWNIFAPPPHVSTSGRPLANASLALNYALGGEDVRGYHVFNIAVHALAALTLFGLLRRTFATISIPVADITSLALAAALLWALHPLQTEAVTYVVQRTESLMGLFYLLTLYAFVRGWLSLAVVVCALGMATKEVMVTAPIVVLLYDRVFVASSWGELFERRRFFYFFLASTWIVLLLFVLHAGDRAGTAGIVGGATPWGYALTQIPAWLHYLRLIVWPHPLVLDYGLYQAPAWRELLPAALVLLLVAVGVIAVCRRRPRAAFAAIAFCLILAPTSSVLPIVTEPMAERRLYLPLAAAIAATAVAVATSLGRRGPVVLTLLAVGCGGLTWARNGDYAAETTLWRQTVAAVSDNPRAHYSLALAYAATGNTGAAEQHFRRALALRPNYVGAHHGYANLLTSLRRPQEAEAEYAAILRVQPEDFVAVSSLGNLAFERGDLPHAIAQFEHALRINPASAEAHNNLGAVYYEQGDALAARRHEEEAIRLRPDSAEAHYNLGNALNRLGLTDAARAAYERALGLKPAYPEAHNNLGNLFNRLGQFAAAAQSYRRAIELAPDYAEAHVNLAGVLERTGDRTGAIEHYRAALRLIPDHAWSRQHLEALLKEK